MIRHLKSRLPLPTISPALRKNAGAALIDSFFRGLSVAGRLDPRNDPAKYGVRHIQDVPYLSTGSPAHTLDLFIPQHTDDPLPVVFYAHGGGFRILSKDTHFGMAMQFAHQGYLVVNINYRLSGEMPFPAAIADTCQAFVWMCRHIEEMGGDLDQLVLAGESAGANLVTALSIAACYPREEAFARAVFDTGVRPKVTAAACGMLQVSDVERYTSQPRVSRFVADRLEEVGHAYLPQSLLEEGGDILELADPLLFLERGEAPERPLPAFFLPVGTRDILLDDTRRLAAALTLLGVPNEARYYPGGVHAFHAFVWLELARKCWEHQFDFIAAHLN